MRSLIPSAPRFPSLSHSCFHFSFLLFDLLLSSSLRKVLRVKPPLLAKPRKDPRRLANALGQRRAQWFSQVPDQRAVVEIGRDRQRLALGADRSSGFADTRHDARQFS